MGAHYPYRREGVPPLTEEESDALRASLVEKFAARGYKAKVRIFEHEDILDHNDFRIRVILKSKDIDPDEYARIRQAWKEQRDAGRPMGSQL